LHKILEDSKVQNMKIVTVASSKGGSGKSTIARGLSVHAALDGLRVLLLDLDPQQTSGGWWTKRERANPLLADLGARTDLSPLDKLDFDLAVIDTPPEHSPTWRSIAAIEKADLVLIPVRPSPDDLESVGLTVKLAARAGRPIAFIPSQTTARAALNAEAESALGEHGPVLPAVALRQEIPKAHRSGAAAVDVKPSGQAAADFRRLWWAVRDRLEFDKRKEALKL
jgi:chromosome partitioning protein